MKLANPIPTYLVVLSLLLSLSCLQAQSDPSPPVDKPVVKRAVLIGIDDYLANPQISDLNGAGNDVELVKTVLVGKFDFQPDDIVVLKDSEATHQNIVDTIRTHLGQSQPGDVAVVHYSGHGSQMRDRDGDEPDRMDETIVPHDSRQGGVFDISDDQINDLMSEIAAKTPNVVFILDSCHSGTAARAAQAQGLSRTARYAPADEREPPPATSSARGLEEISDFRLPGAGYVLISGSQANELSNEMLFGDITHGVMTYYLVDALKSAGVQATYRDVMELTQADVNSRFDDQHPQIEGTGIDTAVFGVDELLPRPYMLVNPVSGGTREAIVGAGEVFGLTVGMELEVYPPGTKIFDESIQRIAKILITKVDDFTAKAAVAQGQVQKGSRAVLDLIQSPDFRLRVSLDNLPSDFRQSLEAKLADYASVMLLDENEDAEIIVRVSGSDESQILVLQGSTLSTLSGLSMGAPDSVDKVGAAIAHWARWHAVLAMRNPTPDLDFDLRILRVDGDSSVAVGETVSHGAKVEIVLTNNSSQDVYPILLDLTDKGRIAPIYPLASLPDKLPPGQSINRRFDATVPDGAQSVTDYVKAIVTTQQISVDAFKLNPLPRSEAPRDAPGQSALERYIKQYARGLTRDLTPVAVTGWATQQRVLRVSRAGVEIDGFAAIFASDDDASRSGDKLDQSGTRAVCGSPGAENCYEIVDYFDDPTMRVILPPRVRSGDRQQDSVGRAFDKAYEYMDDLGARRVEPLFELELPMARSAPVPGDPGTRGLGSDDPLQRAKDDDMWSLKYTRVPEAWAILHAEGKPDGAEATGVLIAHPDTGYIEHAEIWGAPGARPLWPEKGYDYYKNDDSPVDEKIDDNWLDNPAHGTGSSSAIVSDTGCQLAGVTQCPTGVARGAKLVPLRIDKSVVLFNTKRLSRALLDASGDDRSRVKIDTDLAGIAMGGPPSWSLWKAVRKAEERGFIVVAAAGNYVRLVVWPARFDSVVSVAAINAECRPWVHSSRGRSVDIAAPGESVWRGTMAGDNLDVEITSMGTGTTYGTATTSGVVALWVAKHKGTPAYEMLREQGQLTQTLIRLLKKTSWRPGESGVPAKADCAPDASWNARRYGKGIVDAKALLEAPLVTGSTRGERATELDHLPLWWSLYSSSDSLALAQDDYLRVFKTDNKTVALEEVAYYEAEIMFHYASNERLAALIDRLIQGDRSKLSFKRIRQRIRELDTSARLRARLE
ncbi:MAG: caspase family protein [Candidatus Thiodiazotropha taylori]|nr:caspase family protein [Candidatus Thiodiazotropha taylori]MCW4243937.1 caspase family protein [Candidatus Thiodiazotropha taylori]